MIDEHSTEPRTLSSQEAADLVITRRADGQLLLTRDGVQCEVRVRLCFPWSEPTRYFTFRDAKEAEVALVRELADLNEASRREVETSLTEAGFVLQVEAIEKLGRDFELRVWRVKTRQGTRTFQTRLDDWPRELPGGGLLIRDVAGDLFHIRDPHALDERSRKLLWAFMD